MPSHPERGSVLAADLALSAVIVVMVAAIAAGFGRIAATVQDHREAARNAAVIAARTGDLDHARRVAGRISPGAEITIDVAASEVTVTVSGTVEVAHPGAGWINLTTRGEATVPIAPYRSDRG